MFYDLSICNKDDRYVCLTVWLQPPTPAFSLQPDECKEKVVVLIRLCVYRNSNYQIVINQIIDGYNIAES